MATEFEQIGQVANGRHVARHIGIVVVTLGGTAVFAAQAMAIDR
jgi:hypothetical protein